MIFPAAALACLRVILLSLFLVSPVWAQAGDSTYPRPDRLLSKMHAALKESDYSGEFTYEHGSRLESYRIVHRLHDGREYESLVRLTGRESNFFKEGDVSCGTIGGHLLSGVHLTSSDGQYFGIERYYRTSVVGRDRIAGRAAWVVELLPLDEYRFGVTLTIDEQSHLLLRYVIFDARKKIALERMQFVSLDSEALDQSEKPLGAEVISPRCVGETYQPDGHSPWKPGWLPNGFILSGYSFSEGDGHMETYTDGVSSFSIFVKPTGKPVESDGRIRQGVSSRGANMALISQLSVEGSAQQISIVGEIPLSAAQKVSLSVRPYSGAEGGP